MDVKGILGGIITLNGFLGLGWYSLPCFSVAFFHLRIRSLLFLSFFLVDVFIDRTFEKFDINFKLIFL